MCLKKMRIPVMALSLFSASLFLLSCRKKTVTANLITSMNHVCTDFNVDDLSYLINENGTIVSSYAGNEDALNKNELRQFLNELATPFLLDSMVRDSALKEDSSINKLLNLREKKAVYPNDLLAVPANLTDTTLRSTKGIAAAIELLIKKTKTTKKLTANKLIPDKLRINDFDNTKGFFERINGISDFFDQHYPFYKNEDTTIVSLAPTWYSRNVTYFFGWNVFKLQKRTILWKFASLGKLQVLLIKYLDKNILLALSYKDKNITSPVYADNKDLLQSPFGLAIVKKFLCGSNGPSINYSTPSPRRIYKQLLDHQNTPLYFIYLKELISYANLYAKTGKSNQATILFNVYRKLVKDQELSMMVNRPPLVQIDYVTDNADVVTPFEIKKAATIQIFATGQAIINNDYINTAYQYDNLQIFFNKNVDSKLIIRNENKEFEFNYRYDKIHVPPTAQQPVGWVKDSTIRFAYSDPTDTTYILEVAIPWTRLNCPKPKSGTALAMNIFIGDSDLDENQRKSILSWTVKANEDYNDPNIFGRVNLLKKNQKNANKSLTSLKINIPPIIDGRPDPVWNQAYFSSIDIPFQGTPSASDNAARFKSLYDKQNLYLLFEVTDNCKNETGIVTRDKCWIENAENHEIVWKMNGKIIPGSPSFYINKKIQLPAGKYNLRYTSDNGNSADGWYGLPPVNGFYGARLYNLTKPVN